LTTPAGLGLSTWFVPTEGHTTFQINTTTGNYGVETNLSYRDMEVAKMAVYRATAEVPQRSFNSSDVNITDCTLQLAAYEYVNARANGSSFSFETKRQVDLSDGDHGECAGGTDFGCWTWQVMSNGSKMDNSPTLSFSVLDMQALGLFFLSATFKSQWIEGYGNNPNPGLSTVLGGDVDLSQAFQEMAMSMTDYLRNGLNGMLAMGDRIESRIFISIRWYWLVGPVAIELAGLILTVLTIVGNRRNVPSWKSSALAVLACQHDEEENLMRAKVRDMQEIIKVAESSKIRLE
jgi:hypothetical protein